MLIRENIKIYLYLLLTDMRQSIDILCIMVASMLFMEHNEGSLFRCCRGNKIKAIYYDLVMKLQNN